MPDIRYEEIGYMKFSGAEVMAGVIDAGSAGMALIGLDEAVRFFNEKQSPEFARLEYEIPIKTTQGSWIAWVLGAVGVGGGAFALSYLKKAGEKMAENDFKDLGLKDVLRRSVDAIQYLLQLIKHTQHMGGWNNYKIIRGENASEIGILNSKGESLFIPVEYFKWYQSLPPHTISKITDVIAEERSLSIGVKKNGVFEETSVTIKEKVYFLEESTEEDEDYLFPELKHGDFVKLEGRLTRGNTSSNSIGLEYQGHILNCIPDEGSIRRFKPALFLRCVVTGKINRLTKQRKVAEKRPTILVQNITPLEVDDQYDFFEN